MSDETKDALEKLIDVILYGDIEEIPWEFISDKLTQNDKDTFLDPDKFEEYIRIQIAATIRWMIKEEKICSPYMEE